MVEEQIPQELHQSQSEAPRWAFPRGSTEVLAPDRVLFEGSLGRPGFRVQSVSGLRSEIPIDSSIHSPNEKCGCCHRGSERMVAAIPSPHPYWAPHHEEETRNKQTCPSHPGEEKEKEKTGRKAERLFQLEKVISEPVPGKAWESRSKQKAAEASGRKEPAVGGEAGRPAGWHPVRG